ncbi:MAG: hypothetical protein IJR26_00010 [Bacteroidales bacterium]|nr:hypothetical protein [Bacteroidales bacterium]
MQHHTIKSLAVLALFPMLLTTTACAQSNDEAKNVLRLSSEKCLSIQQGHYVMERKMKLMSDKDTTAELHTCDFRKLPDALLHQPRRQDRQGAERLPPDAGSHHRGTTTENAINLQPSLYSRFPGSCSINAARTCS